MYRIQEQANADWHVPQLLWQTAASDKIRGHRHIPEAELAARLWENTPENLRWDLDETIIRELEEQPPALEPEQVEKPQTRAFGSGWQYGAVSLPAPPKCEPESGPAIRPKSTAT